MSHRSRQRNAERRKHKNFRLRPELESQLKAASAARRMTQTAIVEVALEAHLGGVK